MLKASKIAALGIVFAVIAGKSSFAQATIPQIEHYRQQIETCSRTIAKWQWQADLQIAFVIAVIFFGALVTIFQSVNKGWCKPAVLVLGACITILTSVNSKVFSADYRVLQQSVIDGRELVEDLNGVVDGMGRPKANMEDWQKQWLRAKTQFTGLEKAVLHGANKTAGLHLWPRTVYAQSAAPTWTTHPPPSDTDNLYFSGIAEDRSITTARQQSFDNAVAGLARLSNQPTDCDAVRKVIAASAAADKSYFEFDNSKGVYRYYTLLRISSDIKNLHISCERTKSVVVPGQTKWMDTGIQIRKGDKISFTATGRVQWTAGQNVGPEGSTTKLEAGPGRPPYPAPDIGAGGLIAKVGSGPAFAVGKTATKPAVDAGTLYLGINDNSYKDNSGQFSVSISWTSVQ